MGKKKKRKPQTKEVSKWEKAGVAIAFGSLLWDIIKTVLFRE